MKLSSLSVIFIVIAIPIILVVSYYISLQVDTINMQSAYNTKLLDATKEAVDSFEINTAEWNDAYSNLGDSKRRDVMASINTFINSFANNIGLSGSSKDSILPYIPAMAFTLYDGYYIYSPSETKIALKNSNGVTVTMTEKLGNDKNLISEYTYKKEDEGKVLYYCSENATPEGTYHPEGTDEVLKFTFNISDAKTDRNIFTYIKTI